MAIVTVFSGIYCHADEVVAEAVKKFNLKQIDDLLIKETCSRYKIREDKLLKSIHDKLPLNGKISKDRKRHIACLRLTLAEMLQEDSLLLHGHASHLIPMEIPHVLRVCLIGNHDFRVEIAEEEDKKSAKAAAKAIQTEDARSYEWVRYHRALDTWNEENYDVVIPMHDTSVADAVEIIGENLRKDALLTTDYALETVKDFVLAAKIDLALIEKGHDVNVAVRESNVTIEINHYTLRLEQHEAELKKLVQAIPGVKDVTTKLGPRYSAPSIVPMGDFEVPTRMLLVDDEKDFVHTLSERLETRDLQTAVVYDGEEALSYVNKDDPEVIVLDLKMPGIDGLEVLRRVKKTHPHVEVIILTGHGSDKEKQTAFDLGAFAYLQKPANIDQLAEKMREAYRKVRLNKAKALGEEDE